MTWDRKH